MKRRERSESAELRTPREETATAFRTKRGDRTAGGSDNDSGSCSDSGSESDGSGAPCDVFTSAQLAQVGAEEKLYMASEAYETFYKFEYDWPVLCFDNLRCELPAAAAAQQFNLALVCGTQADDALKHSESKLYFSYFENVEPRVVTDALEEEQEYDNEDFPNSYHSHVGMPAPVLRVASCEQFGRFVLAALNDGSLRVFDALETFEKLVQGVESRMGHAAQRLQLFQHDLGCESYAIAWAPQSAAFAAGTNAGEIQLFSPVDAGWACTATFAHAARKAIESVSFQTGGQPVLASGSADGTARVWDLRAANEFLALDALAAGDVNVVEFCPVGQSTHLLLGFEDGSIAVKDIRMPELNLARFKHHRAPVCSANWCPQDPSVILSAGFDNVTVIWDLAVEFDGSQSQLGDLPAQALFEDLSHSYIAAAQFDRTSKYLVISSGAESLNFWKAKNV